ncbi:MAG TPA: hypothetical protein VK140_14050 [Ktedonobacteraceae bacterium]|nr:hypothetical protein [Ktedonobacteraceae bacterium]
MAEEVESRDCSKADFATTAINSLIYEMIQAAKFDVSTGKRRKYAYLSIFGYNDTVYPLLSPEPMDIPFLGEHQRGTVPVVRDVLDTHSGTYRQVTENRAFWIEPRTQGKTQMGQSHIFPSNIHEVAHLDPPFASQMFEMSSVIPEPLRKKATEEFGLGRDVPQGARSFVYNADTNVLVKFLHWGTIGAAIE